MGLTSLHGQLTVSVLTGLGFTPRTADVAAQANEAVDADENQGSDASLTRLHAMRGFIVSGPAAGAARRMQTSEEAHAAVDALLRSRDAAFLEAIGGQDFRGALGHMGAALHTVQDREYHHFEPWPFESLVDSIVNARRGEQYGLPPHYMLLCHAPRDVGYVRGVLNLSLTAFDYSLGYQSNSGWSGGARVEVTQVSTNWWMPHISLGAAVESQGNRGEWTGYGLLTWGRIPARPAASMTPPNPDLGTLAFQRRPALCPEGSEGGNSLIAARQATVDYVSALSRRVLPSVWQQLRTAVP